MAQRVHTTPYSVTECIQVQELTDIRPTPGISGLGCDRSLEYLNLGVTRPPKNSRACARKDMIFLHATCVDLYEKVVHVVRYGLGTGDC